MSLEKLLKKHKLNEKEVKEKEKRKIGHPFLLEIYDSLVQDATQFFSGKKKTRYAEIRQVLTERGCDKAEFDDLCKLLGERKPDSRISTGIALSTIMTVLPAKMSIDISPLPLAPDYLCARLIGREYLITGDVGNYFGFQAKNCTFKVDSIYGEHLGKEAEDCTFYLRHPHSINALLKSNKVYCLRKGRWVREQ